MYHAFGENVDPCMSPADVLRRCRERVLAVRRESEVAAAEGIDEVWTSQRRRGFFWGVIGVEEWAARQKANCLRYGGLEETAERRMRAAMGRKSLAKGEKGGEPSVVNVSDYHILDSVTTYLFVKHKS
jgi:hypothetical protein